jgi:hypothetical protein
MFPTSDPQHHLNGAPPLTTAPSESEHERQPADGACSPQLFAPFIVNLVAPQCAALGVGASIIIVTGIVGIVGIGIIGIIGIIGNIVVPVPDQRGGARLSGPDEEGHRPPHPAPEVP